MAQHSYVSSQFDICTAPLQYCAHPGSVESGTTASRLVDALHNQGQQHAQLEQQWNERMK